MDKVKALRLLVIALAAIALYYSKAEAEELGSRHQVDSYLRYIPCRSARAVSGKVGIIESGSEYSYEFKAFDKLPVKFSLDTNYIGIENTTEVELPSHLTGLTADIEATLPFFKFDKAYLRLGISPAFYGDDWGFQASSFRIPTRYYIIHQPNARWAFIVGLALYPDFEREVLPIVGFIYKPSDKLTFNIIPERPNISYLINDRVTLFTEAGNASSSEFEVTKDNFNNVVLSYREMRVAGGVKFKFNEFIQSSVSAGGVFNRMLKYRDSLGKVNLKDGFYAEFRIEMGL